MQKLQLSIPEPCHENWQQMTPTDQGRFCNACAKEVVDFSMMTDTEVLNYFTTLTHEKVCGRALPSQLDRTIFRPKDPKKRLFWYWNYIVMFLMFFGKGNQVKAQGNLKSTIEFSPMKRNDINKQVFTTGGIKRSAFRREAVKNDSGYTINIVGQTKVVTNKPDFLYIVDGEKSSKKMSAAIFPEDIDEYSVLDPAKAMALFGSEGINGAILITTKKLKVKNLDTVVVSAYGTTTGILIRTTSSSVMGSMVKGVSVRSTITDTLKIVAMKINGAIKIYPNPVQRGNAFNIFLQLKQTGSFQIYVSDAAGRTVLQKQINVTTKEFTEMIPVDNRWSSGLYYISIIDNKNQLISKKSFIVR